MKSVFVPLLVPFFNFENKMVGAVRIYYGVVVSSPYITLSCSTDRTFRKFLRDYRETEFYGYCEMRENPTLNYAINFALQIYFGKTSITRNSGENIYDRLYSIDGSIVVKPSSIRIDKQLLSNDVLLLMVNPKPDSFREASLYSSISYKLGTFTNLSREYSERMCSVDDLVEKTSKLSLCFSCYKTTINYLVKRRKLAKLIRELIQLGIDADSLKVSGLFSKRYVVYVKSPHVQKTSWTI